MDVPDFGCAGDPGSPYLPVRYYNVLLPPDVNQSKLEIRIDEQSSYELAIGAKIVPAPRMESTQSDTGDIRTASLIDEENGHYFNTSAYEKDEYSPHHPVDAAGVGHLRSYAYLTLRYTPVIYNAVRDRAVVADSVRISIEWGPKTRVDFVEDHVLDDVAEQMFVNWNEGRQLYCKDAVESAIRTSSLESSQVGYLIVTTNSIVSGSEELNNFKTYLEEFKGYDVNLVTEDTFGYSTGTDKCIAIRNWLKDHYQILNLRYVLLIGNPSGNVGIPMMQVWPKVLATDVAPGAFRVQETYTDFFYADLTGNWDADNDGYYGEINDGQDLSPEVLVGRLPFYGSFADLDYILDKIVKYRFAESVDDRKSALLAMAVCNYYSPRTDGTYLAEDFIDNLLDASWSYSVLYEAGGVAPVPSSAPYYSKGLTRQDFIDEWQEGYGCVLWFAHGSDTTAVRRIWNEDSDHDGTCDDSEYSDTAFFSSTDSTQLDNSKPSISFLISCYNGNPNCTDNVGYSLLRHGSIATVSSSRVSYYNPGYWSAVSMKAENEISLGYGFFEQVIRNSKSIGDALYIVKSDPNLEPAGDRVSLTNVYDYNLYGDPSLSLYDVDESGGRLRKNGNEFTVSESKNVDRGSGYPGGVTLSTDLFDWDDAYATYLFRLDGISVEKMWVGVHAKDTGIINTGPGLEIFNYKSGSWNVLAWPYGKEEKYYAYPLVTPTSYLSPAMKYLKVRVHASWNDATDLWYVDVVYAKTPESIDVSSPDGGESWSSGSVQSIKWSSSGSVDKVRVDLFQGDSRAATISCSTPNTGFYSWALSSSSEPRSDYNIRVSDIDETLWDASHESFTIFGSGSNLPTAPRNLEIRWNQDMYPSNARGLNLAWDIPYYEGNLPVSGYNIYRGTNADILNLVGYVSAGAPRSYVDYNIGYDITYYYYVRALNPYGESGSSNKEFYKVPPGGTNYIFVRTTTCRDVEIKEPYRPIGETHVFKSTDWRAITWLNVSHVMKALTVMWEYIGPSGLLYMYPTYYPIPDPAQSNRQFWPYYVIWYGWDIAGDNLASMEGQWHVNVYIDEGAGFVKVSEERFTIRYEVVGRAMAQNVQPQSPYDTISPTTCFYNTDPIAYAWIKLVNVAESINVKWNWYNPNGALYSTYDWNVPPSTEGPYWGWYVCWGSMYISNRSANSMLGLWTVEALIQDSRGAWDLQYKQVFQLVDNTLPGFPGIPNSGCQYSNTAGISYVWDPAYEDDSVCQYHLQVGTTPGGNDAFDGLIGDEPHSTIANLSEGVTYYARVQAMNYVGQWGDWSPVSDGTTIDTQGPDVSWYVDGTLGANGYYVGYWVGVSLWAYDWTSGVRRIWYTLDGVDWTEYLEAIYFVVHGIYTLWFYAEDNAGNPGMVYEVQVPFDTRSPWLQVFINDGSLFTNSRDVSVLLDAEDDISGVWLMSLSQDGVTWSPWSWYESPVNIQLSPGDGEKIVYAQVMDRAGYVSEIAYAFVVIDTRPPSTQIETGGTRCWEHWYTSSVLVWLNASDSSSGVRTTYYKLDSYPIQTYHGPFSVGSYGMHMIVYYSVDNVNNLDFEHTFEIGITSLVEFTMSLQKGWNLVSIPVMNDFINASTLGLGIGDIVVPWDSLEQSYGQSYVVGTSPSSYDFPLIVGSSYFIYSASGENIVVGGCSPDVSDFFAMPLYVPEGGGWVSVGFNSLGGSFNAVDFASFVVNANVKFVSRWNCTSSGYDDYVIGASPDAYNFQLIPGQGYWLWIDHTGLLWFNP